MSEGPILNNGTQSAAEKSNVWRLKKTKYILWMDVFAETKPNEEREIYEDILGKKILLRKPEKKGDFRNVVIDLNMWLQHNNTFSLHNSILLPANMKNYFLC